MKFTVIIATHHRPALLPRAIRSVKQQASGEATVIVVSDDGSAATRNIAASHLSGEDIYIERAGEPGPARSRNLGLAAAGRNTSFSSMTMMSFRETI